MQENELGQDSQIRAKLPILCGICEVGEQLLSNGKKTCPHNTAAAMVTFYGPLDAEFVIVSSKALEMVSGDMGTKSTWDLLQQGLNYAGIEIEKVLFVNALNCKACKPIKPKHVEVCIETYLKPVLKLYQRKVIVCLGNEARYAIHPEVGLTGILKTLGTVEDNVYGGKSVWTCNPSLLFFKPEFFPVFYDDLKKANEIFSGDTVKEVVLPEIRDVSGSMEDALLAIIDLPERFAVDIETSGLDSFKNFIVGIAFSGPNHAFYFPIIAAGKQCWTLQEFETLMFAIKTKIEMSKIIVHNGKFDFRFLTSQFNISPKSIEFDTMLAQQLINENLPLNLEFLSQRYLGIKGWKDVDHRGKNLEPWQRSHPNIWVPLSEMGPYAARDAACTYLLYEPVKAALIAEGCEELFNTITMPLLEVLLNAELIGLKIDQEGLEQVATILQNRMEEIRKEIITKHVPVVMQDDFNIGSSKQMGWLLYTHLGIKPKVFTDTNQPSTNKEAMEAIEDKHPIGKLLSEYRHVKQLDTTFVSGVKKYIKADGKVHTVYAYNPKTEAAVKTGRINSMGPNVMNIPKNLRPLYMADDGFSFLWSDGSQMELRCMAVESGDEQLKEAIANDVHKTAAAEIFKKPLDEITDEERKAGKTVNFAVIYGLGVKSLSTKLDLPVWRAQEIMDGYWSRFPDLKKWIDLQVITAQQTGEVTARTGRKRRLPSIHSTDKGMRSFAERQAPNSPIQGMGADILHIKAIELMGILHDIDPRINSVNFVHDEILIHCPTELIDIIPKDVMEILHRQPMDGFDIPLVWDYETGTRWTGELNLEKILT